MDQRKKERDSKKVITATVVVYNKRCEESTTCLSLLKQSTQSFEVVVFDNSTTDLRNRSFCGENRWIYLGDCTNVGLSKAYNRVVDLLAANNTEGYICLLDDDTSLPDYFIEKMESSIKANPDADILVPILLQRGKLISPALETRSGIGRYFSSVDECLSASTERMQMMNSCMTVRLDIFRNYRYDERIFLDGTDHAFIRDMKSQKKKIIVADVICDHSFSGGEEAPVEASRSRFMTYVKDSGVLYENSRKKFWLIVGKRALHLCVIYKTTWFARALIRCCRKESKGDKVV